MHDIFIVRNSKNEDNCSYIKERFPHAVPIGPGNKKDLFAHVCNLGTTEHAWILDDRCDYSNFDFEYYPPWHQNSQMHVWPTENQDKGGDTVLLNRWEYLQQYNDLDYVQNYQAVAWKKIKIEEKESPEIFMWCRVPNLAKDFDDGITRMRYVGTELDMLKRTVRKASGKSIWIISDNIDYDGFDFAWRPNWEHSEYLHVWPTENQELGGDTMYVNVAQFLSQDDLEHLSHYRIIQWHEQLKQKLLPTIVSWTRENPVEGSDISLRYIGSELDMMKRTLSKIDTPYFWIVSDSCDYADFDFRWRPSWATQSHLHVWPTENQDKGGDTMYVNAAEMKTQILALEELEQYSVINWKNDKVKQKVQSQIVSWTRENPVDGADISLRYIGTELDMMKRTLRKIDTPYFWIVSDNCDYTGFDFDWRPGWATQKHLHVWPNQNQKRGGDTMYVNAAEMKTQILALEELEHYSVINWKKDKIKQKGQTTVVSWTRNKPVEGSDISLRYIGAALDMMKRTLSKVNTPYFWVVSDECDYTDFNFNWSPGWSKHKYLHVWSNQNQERGGDTMYVNTAQMQTQLLEIENLEDYNVIEWQKKQIKQKTIPQVVAWSRSGDVPGSDIPLRYIGSELDMMRRTINKVDTPYFWIVNDNCDYTDFNFNWRPGWSTQHHLHVWPTEDQDKGGDTMYVNTAEMKSQLLAMEALENYSVINWHKDCLSQPNKPEIIAWSRSGDDVPGANITMRYIGTELEMMNRTLRKASTPYFWIINENCDYSDFNFDWRPGWATQSYLHVWPTENQDKGGDTMYVNAAEMKSQAIGLEHLEHYNVIDWHKDSIKQLTKPQVVGWSRTGQDVDGADITLRYIGTDLEMMNRTLRKIDTPYFWVISDNCEYTDFDFDWRPSWSNQHQLHVWPTENQIKGGDTMYVNAAEMNGQIVNLEHLEHYDVINWHKDCIKEKINPQVVAWSRTGQGIHGADIALRYLGSELDMMSRTLRKVDTPYFWIISDTCDYTDFDFKYRPGWATQNYLHVWPTENQTKGGDTMYVNTAHMVSQLIELEELEHYDVINWHKDCIKEKTKPQIIAWSRSGNDVDGADITLRYIGSHLEMVNRTLRKVDTTYFWIISENCDYTDFDFDWRPSWSTQNQLHVWPTEGQERGGDTIYVNTAEIKNQMLNLEQLEHYNVINWHKEHIPQLVKPQIVGWSRSGQDVAGADITLRYIGSELDMMNRTVRKVDTPYFWVISDTCDYSEFDFDWRPMWAQEKYMHVWPTEDQVKGGDTMYVNTAEMKSQAVGLENLEHYDVINWQQDSVKQQTKPQVVAWSRSGNSIDGADITLRYLGSELDMMNRTLSKVSTPYFWVISDICDYSDFNFDWRPTWATQNYLHVWPTENQIKGGDTMYVNAAEMKSQTIGLEHLEHYDVINWQQDSVKQLVQPEVFVWDSTGNADLFPDATVLRNVGDKFSMLEKTVRRASTPYIWILNNNNDYSDFDFDWRPSWATQSHLHVWPSGTQTHGGDTMYVNVAEFKKQALEMESLDQYVPINWHSTVVEQIHKPDVVIWDGGDNTDYIKERFPDAYVMRNIGSRYDMMCRTMRHVENDTAWVINSKCDYSQFDFSWRPGWDTETQLHVWPTENQVKGGDTYYVDVREFKKQSLEITDLDQYNSVNWHKQSLRLQTTSDIVIWTFGGNDDNLDSIKQQYPNAKSLRYVGTHLEMVKKSAKYANTDYFWVLSDCCEYADFDANWRPDWETENSIHCWASGEQKFGDTFYVPKKQFLQEADDLNKLEYYSSVIWYEHGYSRLPWPVTQPDTDDMFNSVRSHTFSSIYEYFVAPGSTLGSTVDVSLWEKRSLVAYNKNGHVILCPRDCISQISTKLAEYPYIQYYTCENSTQKPQDIVFISYDEKEADLNYEILKKQQPAATRVHGVEGMVNALKAAAETSTTPWYYAVFAKTQVSEQFEFNFNPNYLDIPGNYIFHAYNTITDYTYGHGAVLMYHSKTVREATSWGFDFTTSFPYTYIPLMSCVVDSKTPWEAWRTSFREVLKLREMGTVESQYRMNRWLTVGKGDVGEWSILGAQDAISYTGSLEEANDWHWLRNYFTEQHPQHQ